MNEHFRYVLPTIGTLLVYAGRAAFYAVRPPFAGGLARRAASEGG